MKLNNKHVLITGASSGIGAEIAKEVAKNGGVPILIARSEEKLQQIAKEIEIKLNVKVKYYSFDLEKMDQIPKLIEEILYDVDHIDIVVNNAGFGIFEYLVDTNISEIDSMFRVNVLSLIAITKAVLPYMKENNHGQIINVASQAGKVGSPKSTIYAATKHAVLGFSNSLRMELAKTNIRITTINPGPIATNFFERADQTGEYVKNIGKYMLQADYVAEKVVAAMIRPKREVNLPGWMNIGSIFYQLFPALFEKLIAPIINKK